MRAQPCFDGRLVSRASHRAVLVGPRLPEEAGRRMNPQIHRLVSGSTGSRYPKRTMKCLGECSVVYNSLVTPPYELLAGPCAREVHATVPKATGPEVRYPPAHQVDEHCVGMAPRRKSQWLYCCDGNCNVKDTGFEWAWNPACSQMAHCRLGQRFPDALASSLPCPVCLPCLPPCSWPAHIRVAFSRSAGRLTQE